MSGLSKEELRSPDAFVAYVEKAMHWLYERRQIAAAIVLVLFIGSAAYLGWQQFEVYQNKKAAEAIFKDEKPLRAYLVNLVGTPTKPAVVSEADLKPLVEKWQKALNDNKGQRAAIISFMNMTQLLREKGQLETVRAMTETLNPSLKKSDFLWALWRFQKAGVFSETGENDKAIASLQEIIKEKQANWLHGEALVRLGMIYEKTDKNQAMAAYEKVLAEHSQTAAAAMARRLLDQIKQKNG